jgi:hypothetical protein
MFVGHLTGPPDSNTQAVFIMTHFIFSLESIEKSYGKWINIMDLLYRGRPIFSIPYPLTEHGFGVLNGSALR